MSKMLSTKEVAEKLNMGINQTRQLIKKANFPKIIIGKRKWIIPEDALDEWIKKNLYHNISI